MATRRTSSSKAADRIRLLAPIVAAVVASVIQSCRPPASPPSSTVIINVTSPAVDQRPRP